MASVLPLVHPQTIVNVVTTKENVPAREVLSMACAVVHQVSGKFNTNVFARFDPADEV
jgi:hypothetical protein